MFLTILFLLIFSLVGVALEHARILSSEGYVRVASHSAAMTIFGNYNKELYDSYGFFAYGGSDGKGVEALENEFTGILSENLQTAPQEGKRIYGNLYRLQGLDVSAEGIKYLTEKEVFLEQIEAYLRSEAVQDLTDRLLKKNQQTEQNSGIQDKLNLTKEYEEGKFQPAEEREVRKGNGEKQNTSKEYSKKKKEKEENPLKVFSRLMRDGVLELVCDSSKLSEGIIEKRGSTDGIEKSNIAGGKKQKGAADYLEGILGTSTDGWKDCTQGNDSKGTGMDKVKYICYANQQFSSYTEDKKRTTSYGREYLVAGRQEERDNLSYTVNKLLRTRLLLNFVSIVADKILQEKSFATAALLAGFTGMPPVIRAVQYTILLIFAFEEACVDVAALLEGRKVPVVKRVSELKMRYEEICMVSKEVFASKAAEYSKGGKSSVGNITYDQYLWLFLLEQQAKELQQRCLDLIQYDLREKYNQTFTIDTCICHCRYKIQYISPFLYKKLPFLFTNANVEKMNEMEVEYGYQSG